MKAELLHSLKVCFSKNKKLSLATFLDPRFKDKLFSNNIIKATIKEMVVVEMSTFAADFSDLQNTEIEGPTRPKRLYQLNSSIFLDVFSELLLRVMRTSLFLLVKWRGT